MCLCGRDEQRDDLGFTAGGTRRAGAGSLHDLALVCGQKLSSSGFRLPAKIVCLMSLQDRVGMQYHLVLKFDQTCQFNVPTNT